MDREKRRIIVGLAVGLVLPAVIYFAVIADRCVEVNSGFRQVMGTWGRIVVIASDNRVANRCVEAGFEQLDVIENSMSAHAADSELSRVNRDAFARPVEVSDSFLEVLRMSLEFSRKTGGAFDITVGPLIELYKTAEAKGVKPGTEEIELAKSRTGFEKLKLDEQNKTVRFEVEGMRLDLGGIAKGYAIEKAVEVMRSFGAAGGIVDVGGDIRCFGQTKAWKIGLQAPDDADNNLIGGNLTLVLELSDSAVATSGDYRRFVLIEGKKYSHIIDRTTAEACEGLSSVTIIAPNAAAADALATAVSVMGADKGAEFIESEPGVEAILISSGSEFKIKKTSDAEKYIAD